jgi:hypothetical protein
MMNKILSVIFLYSLNVHALTFNNSMEMADSSFYPFYYNKYFEWQKEHVPCLCEPNLELDKFTKQKLNSYTNWSQSIAMNVKRQNFQILYRRQAQKVTKTLILNISNSDFENSSFKIFLKKLNVSFDLNGKTVKSFQFNYFSKELQFTYTNTSRDKWYFISYQNGKVISVGDLKYPSIEKSFSNKYIPYLEHFVHQEKFINKEEVFHTRTYLKVFNILTLPKELQLLMLNHKREWNLDSVTIYTSHKDEIGIYYP